MLLSPLSFGTKTGINKGELDEREAKSEVKEKELRDRYDKVILDLSRLERTQ